MSDEAERAAQPDVVLLGGSHRSSLCFVRSLGRRGLTVWVVDGEHETIAAQSRHCARELTCPSPGSETEAFVEFVADLSHRHGDAVFVPMLELTLVPLQRSRERLGGHWVLPTDGAMQAFFDKGKTQELAQSLDIPVPPCWTSEEISQQPRGSYTIPVPAVVKPTSTVGWGDGAGRYRRVVHARDRQDLERIIEDFGEQPYVVQRFFDGVGVGVFGLFDHGKPLMLFQHQRIRDVNPTGSGSSYRRSVPLDPELVRLSCKLLAARQWHGLAMVEFRVAVDGAPYLIEVNGRPWGSIQLAVLAGVDFPYGLYRLARGQSVPPSKDYRTDIHARWLVGDLMHLMSVMRGPPDGWEGAYPGRLATLARMAMPYRPGLRYDHLSLDDSRPALAELAQFVTDGVLEPIKRRIKRNRTRQQVGDDARRPRAASIKSPPSPAQRQLRSGLEAVAPGAKISARDTSVPEPVRLDRLTASIPARSLAAAEQFLSDQGLTLTSSAPRSRAWRSLTVAGETPAVAVDLLLAPDRRGGLRELAAIGRWLIQGVTGKTSGPVHRTGVEVALIGIDGCGKSTLARNLEERFPLPVKTLYMGHKDFVTYPMKWVAGRKRAARGRSLDGKLEHLPNRYLVFAATHWEWFNRRLRGYWLARRGYVVVYDRHIVERLRLDGGWKARAHNAVAKLYTWPVDETLLLDGSPDAFYSRKPEWSRGELEEKHSDLQSQLGYLGGAVTVIDAEKQGPEAVYRQAAGMIVQAFNRQRGMR